MKPQTSYFQKIRSTLISNKKIIENYFFMTVLQILNSLFYLFIYPYLIRTLGVDTYGLYVLAISIANYAAIFIALGLDFPATQAMALAAGNHKRKEEILSRVFTAKMYCEFVALILFSVLLFIVPLFRENKAVLFVCFMQTLVTILFPQWYFQATQRMRIVTYIQLGFKLISLPLIFLLVHHPSDLLIFVWISVGTTLAGALVAWGMMRYKDHLKISWRKISDIKQPVREAIPFFLHHCLASVKELGVIVFISFFFGLKDTAIYDLANKIISVPRVLIMNINGALFPKIVVNAERSTVKKILKSELFLGLLIILSIILFGKWVVILLGGTVMSDAYGVAILLSVTILAYLIVSAYVDFVFIPNGKRYFIFQNQLGALCSLLAFVAVGLLFAQNVYILAGAIAFSGLFEVGYCYYLVKKNQLL